MTADLRAELARWDEELVALEEECAAEGWAEPEKLLLALHRTIGTYRRRVLPSVSAETVLPAFADSDAPGALTILDTIITDELGLLIDRMEEVRLELIRSGHTPRLQLRAIETLAAVRALGTVLLRFGQEARSGERNRR